MQVTVGSEWKRHEFTFTPTRTVPVHRAGWTWKRPSATPRRCGWTRSSWSAATMRPPTSRGSRSNRSSRPARRETSLPHPAAGLTFTLRAFNNTEQRQAVPGKLPVTDFFDRRLRGKAAVVCACRLTRRDLRRSPSARCRGFFRASWTTPRSSLSLRAARSSTRLRRAKSDRFAAGFQPRVSVAVSGAAGPRGRHRLVARLVGQMADDRAGDRASSICPPPMRKSTACSSSTARSRCCSFPSANWSSSAPEDVLRKAGNGKYPAARLPVAYAPKRTRRLRPLTRPTWRGITAKPAPPVTTSRFSTSRSIPLLLPRNFGYTGGLHARAGSGHRAHAGGRPAMPRRRRRCANLPSRADP